MRRGVLVVVAAVAVACSNGVLLSTDGGTSGDAAPQADATSPEPSDGGGASDAAADAAPDQTAPPPPPDSAADVVLTSDAAADSSTTEGDATTCPGTLACSGQDAAVCGPLRQCIVAPNDAGGNICIGLTGACCTAASDCCSFAADACAVGFCSSIGVGCASDSDCSGEAVCFPVAPGRMPFCGVGGGVCWIPPGGHCGGNQDCSSYACNQGICAPAAATAPPGDFPCRTVADCASGVCQNHLCQRVGEGMPCNSELDCINGDCIGGFCHCLHPGATALNDVDNAGCCTGYVFLGKCATAPLMQCMSATDCLGGTCAPTCNGSLCCSCVGAGGICNGNGDCCAGSTQCVNNVCQ